MTDLTDSRDSTDSKYSEFEKIFNLKKECLKRKKNVDLADYKFNELLKVFDITSRKYEPMKTYYRIIERQNKRIKEYNDKINALSEKEYEKYKEYIKKQNK